MKKIIFAFSFLLNFFCVNIYAQGEFVIEINQTNGNYTKTGPAIPPIQWIFPEVRAYDENFGYFIFPSSAPNYLFSINVVNGATVSNPAFADLYEFQFDNSDSTLFAYQQTAGMKTLVSVNTTTGIGLPIGNSLPAGLFQGLSTYNQNAHQYIFIDPPNLITTVDVTNGNIISNPSLILNSNESIINICFNNANDTLYGLLQDNTVYQFYLVSIDVNTGVVTRIGAGTNIGAGNGSSTIDEANQQYIYLSNPGSGYSVTTLDIPTGTMVTSSLINTLDPIDNFVSLKYDNVRGKLFSIHWDNFIDPDAGVNPIENNSNEISVFPNPSNGIFEFDFSNSTFLNGEIIITDILGNRIFQSKIENLKSKIDLSTNSNGIYFYSIKSENGNIASGKLILAQ